MGSSSSTSPPPELAGHTDLSSPDGDAPGQIRIDAYDATSFELSIAGKIPGSTRRRKVSGPIVLSAPAGFVARWKVAPAAAASASPSSSSSGFAAIAALVSPRPDIVLVGTGRATSSGSSSSSSSGAYSTTARETSSKAISDAAGGAAVEFHPTARAAALYNVLSQEGRSVLVAMLPAGEDVGSLFLAKR